MSDGGYRSKLLLHMSLSKGGSLYNYELTDYPGIIIVQGRKTSKDKFERKVLFEDQEFSKIEDALLAFKKAKP